MIQNAKVLIIRDFWAIWIEFSQAMKVLLHTYIVWVTPLRGLLDQVLNTIHARGSLLK